jgi:hypothetical protein
VCGPFVVKPLCVVAGIRKGMFAVCSVIRRDVANV